MPRPLPQDDEGFTLVETIVSLTIFAIVSAAAVLALVTGIDSNDATTERVTASQLAQAATDRARAMPKAELVATPTTSSTETVGERSYTVTRTVTYPDSTCLPATAIPAPDDTAVRKLAVRVEVSARGSRTVRVDSVIAC